MKLKQLMISIALISSLGVKGQLPYDSVRFGSPLDIPLLLAGNFAELRRNHFHTGLDIKTKGIEGLKLYAVEDGYISRINIAHYGYGKAIYITHPNGYTSVYAHCSGFPDYVEAVLRKKQFECRCEVIDAALDSNEIVLKKGDYFAISGNSGSSMAPHLHFEIRETISERPVNPLLFNFEITDDISPTLQGVKFYAIEPGASVLGQKEKLFTLTGSKGDYKLNPNKPVTFKGKIGVGIQAIDKLNGAPNVCGIYAVKLLVDGKIVFYQEMDKLDFSTSRYINIHKDYDEFHRHGRNIHKSFLKGNNQLDIYDSIVENGYIWFNDADTHALKYIVTDIAGNKSELNFKLISTGLADSLSPQLTVKYGFKEEIVFNQDEEFIAVLPEHTLYDETALKYKKEAGSGFSDKHLFHIPGIPAQKYFVLHIKTKNIPQGKEDKAVVVNVGPDGSKAAKSGVYENGFVKTEVRDFGAYQVELDTIAPNIVAENVSNGKTFTSGSNLIFRIGDNLSGIKRYNAFIDDEWKISFYSPRSGKLTLPLDKYNVVLPGNHKLRIEVSDDRNNIKSVSYDIIVK